MNKQTVECELRGQVIRGADSIAELSKDWDDLFTRSKDAPAFLSRAWTQTFINQKHFKGNPYLIAVWSDKKLVALLPFTVHKICGIRIAQPIGLNVPSYLGLLLDPDYAGAIDITADVWIRENIADAFYNKYLSSLDKPTNQLFREFKKRGCKFKCGFPRLCPWIRLGCSFDEYLQKNKSRKSRKKLRSTERKIKDNGNVKIIHYKGKEITREVYNRIANIQIKSWQKRRGAAVLGQSFYQKLLAAMADYGLSQIWLMTINGDDTAFSYVLEAHKQLYYKWTAFKLKYKSPLSYGKILTMHLIREACEENIESIDLGLGNSKFKRFWATDNHDVERVIVGRGVLGHLAVACYSTVWRIAENKRFFSIYSRLRRWYLVRKQRQQTPQKNKS